MEYLIQESTLTNIADAIRTKKGQADPISPLDMPDEIMSIRGGGEGGNPIPLTTSKNGTYTNADGFNPVKINVPANEVTIENVVDGKWVCPEDWDDVETIPLPSSETEQVLYLVYRTDLPLNFISYRIAGAAYKYTKGHCVDGAFVPTEPSVNKTSGSYIQEVLTNDYATSGKNTIVFKLEPQSTTSKITATAATSYSINGISYNYQDQSLVIRYGQLYYASNISYGSCHLECDNIQNCKSLTTLANLYYITTGCFKLKKHRHYGWDTSKVTTFGNMFYYCKNLIDCDLDFSNWVTDKCTSLANMFAYCHNLVGDVKVTGWNTSNVTSCGSLFRECYYITRVIGVENLYFPKSYTSDYMFYFCSSLYQNDEGVLDLSNWHLGENTTTTYTKAWMFGRCYRLKKINMQNFDLSKATSLTNLFYENRGLQEIDMRNIVPPTSTCTNLSQMFTYCTSLETILHDGDGIFYNWDLSKVANIYSLMHNCLQLKNINFGTPLDGIFAGSTGNSTASVLFNHCPTLETVDMRNLNIKNFTYNQLTGWFGYNFPCFKEFYPPQGINNNFTLSWFPASISKESLLRVIENLLPQTATKTLALGTATKAKLTAEEIAVATQKGWTVT